MLLRCRPCRGRSGRLRSAGPRSRRAAGPACAAGSGRSPWRDIANGRSLARRSAYVRPSAPSQAIGDPTAVPAHDDVVRTAPDLRSGGVLLGRRSGGTLRPRRPVYSSPRVRPSQDRSTAVRLREGDSTDAVRSHGGLGDWRRQAEQSPLAPPFRPSASEGSRPLQASPPDESWNALGCPT